MVLTLAQPGTPYSPMDSIPMIQVHGPCPNPVMYTILAPFKMNNDPIPQPIWHMVGIIILPENDSRCCPKHQHSLSTSEAFSATQSPHYLGQFNMTRRTDIIIIKRTIIFSSVDRYNMYLISITYSPHDWKHRLWYTMLYWVPHSSASASIKKSSFR